MRGIITLFFLFACIQLYATNFYVKNGGNDGLAGTSDATAWATTSKVTNMGFQPGDTIFFARGSTFTGQLRTTMNGTALRPIVYTAYGSGAKPIFTGLATITGWANLGGNIWEATTSGVKVMNNLVMRNSVIQQVGRFPNTNAANGGYLISTASTTTSITGPALSTTTNWTGAQVAVRNARWEMRMRIVTGHSGGVVSYSNLGTTVRSGYGYFFQRDARTLDQDGEWYQSTNKLRMYFGNNNPNAYTIQAAITDSIIVNSRSYNTFLNLAVTGSNKGGIVNYAGTNTLIKGCDISFSGGDAILGWTIRQVTVENCTVTHSLGSGIRLYSYSSPGAAGLTVKGNTIINTALITGMQMSDISSSGKAIKTHGGNNIEIINNYIRNCGYNGIDWQGDNVNIKYNLVDTFCTTMDDGGAIYCYEGPGSVVRYRTNRNIVNNILINGFGNNNGGGSEPPIATGIYTDEGTRDIRIDSNTIAYRIYNGFHGNGNSNLTYRHNTVFGATHSHAWQRLANENPIDSIVFTRNILYPYRWRFRDQARNLPTTLTTEQNLARVGRLDSNWYSTKTGTDTSLRAQTETNPASGFLQIYRAFSYLTGTAFVETHSINAANTGTLEYNASSSPRSVLFPGLSYMDPKGTVYNNFVTIPAWGSVILIANGSVNTPPTSDAGVDKAISLPTTSVSVTGSGTNGSGTSRTYVWSQISGPSTATNSTPTNATTTFGNLNPGTYSFKLKVRNNLSDTAIDVMNVVVTTSNSAPTANAGGDISITLPTSSTTLSGSGTDNDGTISSYAWVKVSGPAGGTIVSASSASTAINSLQQGTYVFQLTVTDNGGLTNSDIVQVLVGAVNNAPTANAGEDKAVTLPVNTTTLTGSGNDPDGSIAAYGWVKISGPAGGTIASPTSTSTAINSLQQGTYVYQFTVTDNLGLTGSDFVQVVVSPDVPPVNIPPTANAGNDTTITLPANTANLSGSGIDNDGYITSYLWRKISGPTGGAITSSTSATTTVTGLTQGDYFYQLRVTDNSGDTATDVKKITVNAANLAPSVDAGANQVITLPTSSTTLTGTATDADGTISSVQWTKQSGPAGGIITSSTSNSTTITSLQAGDYIFQFKATDNTGDSTTDAVQITVNAANIPPTSNAGPDQSFQLPINSTTLDGTGSTDPEGPIASYSWIQTSGPSTATLATPNASTTAATDLQQGDYIFQLTVFDNSGDSSVDAVLISVLLATNVAPIADAGSNQTITLTDSVTLVGSATDADGTISTYLWTGPGTILTPDSATTIVKYLPVGNHVFTLTVTDDQGATSTDTVVIIVNQLNNNRPVILHRWIVVP